MAWTNATPYPLWSRMEKLVFQQVKKQIVSTTPSPYNAVLQQNLLTALMIQQAMDLTHRVCFAFVKLISLKCKKNWSRFRPGSHPAWTDYRTSFSKSVLMCWHHLYIISSTFLLNKALIRSNGRLLLSHRYLNKKGNRSDPKFYRPISFLSSVSKVFERLVHKQLMEFCFENTVFPDCQYGFLPKRSTVWQLLSITNDWAQAIDHGKRVHACFLDVAKAFDRVDHNILEVKLSSIGVRGCCLQWFSSYLRGRKIRTKIDGTLSEAKSISSGVPQGSVLGPLLFIIFFMDLHVGLQSTCALFADDTLLYDINCTGNSLTSPCCAIKDDLVRLDTWSDNCNVQFNPEKSAQMYIARRQAQNMDQLSPSAITLNGRAIPVVSSTKHLGVHLCETLRWSGHVDSLIQRTQKQLFILRRLAGRPFASLLVSAVYKGMVRPMLEYASVVWEPTKNSTLVALERSQLSIARAITRLPRRRHSNEAVLAKIGWPTLAWRRRRYKLLLVWRLVNGEGPPSLSSFFSLPLSSRSHYSLRNPHSLPQVPPPIASRTSSLLLLLFGIASLAVSASVSHLALFLLNLIIIFLWTNFLLVFPDQSSVFSIYMFIL